MGGNKIRGIPYIKIGGGLICGGALLYAGIQMIFKDIAASGLITLKIFGNELSATNIGIAVIFIGAVIIILTIRWPLSKESEINTVNSENESQLNPSTSLETQSPYKRPLGRIKERKKFFK